MKRLFLLSSVLSFSILLAFPAAAAGPRALPNLGRRVRVDGRLREYARGLRLRQGPLDARVGWYRDALYLGIRVRGAAPDGKGALDVTLHFPEPGITSRAYVFRFQPSGELVPPTPGLAPEFARALVRSATHVERHDVAFEVKVPIRAFPRFPATGRMKLDLCLTWKDAAGQTFANCQNGSMKRPLVAPDDLRRAARIHVPSDIISLEPADGGWLGYGVLFYPEWIEADEAITVPVLERLLPGEALDPAKAQVGLDHQYELPDGRVLLSVLSGKNPYAVAGDCNPNHEMRLGLFLVKGRSAQRVLDRPASNCTLGRASSVVLDDKGNLTITYSNGGVSHFDWSKDAFEHTDIG